MRTPLIHHLDRLVNSVSTLERVGIGASAMISGHIVHREGQHTFRFHYRGEAMFGSAGTVVDWIVQLKNETIETGR